MKIPDNVNFILQKLCRMGFKAYLVGGCVRDAYMEKQPKDWDIATDATPEKVKVLFPRTYGTGLKHGTVTVLFNDQKFEVTTFRVDGEYKDFRRPESVTYSNNIEDDLKRRDFTINAIAYNSEDGYVDPFGGIADISKKLIKGVGIPSDRFREDALRMLRAVRFSAQLGFEIDEKTSEAIIENADLIKNISAERIREELHALLSSPFTNVVFTREFLSLIELISAPLAESIDKNRNSLERLFENCKKDVALRFSVLIYYLNCNDAEIFIKKLKFSNNMRDRLLRLHKVRNEKIGNNYSDVASIINNWGFETFEDYLYLQMLNCIANDSDLDYIMSIEFHYRDIIDNNLPISIKDLAVNGYDLNQEFSITGIALGKTLSRLLEYVHSNPYKNNYEDLLKEAYGLITKG